MLLLLAESQAPITTCSRECLVSSETLLMFPSPKILKKAHKVLFFALESYFAPPRCCLVVPQILSPFFIKGKMLKITGYGPGLAGLTQRLERQLADNSSTEGSQV